MEDEEFKVIYLDGKSPIYDTTLQILISKELKREAQKVALQNDETLSQVIRRELKWYIEENKAQTLEKPKKKLIKKKSND